MNTVEKKSRKDRHKPGTRKTVNLPPELCDRIAALAKKNRRPFQWEVELALENHLKANLPSDDQAD